MDVTLVHNRPDTSKIDPFNGTFFKRWQERIFSTIDVVNLGHVVTEPKPQENSGNFRTWESENKLVRHAILSTLTNEIFDIYCHMKIAKEIWDAMNKKYVLEDAGTQKYVIGNFRNFQMVEDRDVSSQIHEFHLLVNDLANEEIKLPEPFVAGYLIETLPESWKDYKNNMKHKRKQMSLEDVIIHIRIEEQNRNRDNSEKLREMSSKANVVQEKTKPKYNRSRNQTSRTKPNRANKIQNPAIKKKDSCFVCGKPGHYAVQCRHRKRFDKSNQNANLVETEVIAAVISSEVNMLTDVKE